MRRLFAALLAALLPAQALADGQQILPDFRYVPTTYVQLQTFSAAIAVTGASTITQEYAANVWPLLMSGTGGSATADVLTNAANGGAAQRLSSTNSYIEMNSDSNITLVTSAGTQRAAVVVGRESGNYGYLSISGSTGHPQLGTSSASMEFAGTLIRQAGAGTSLGITGLEDLAFNATGTGGTITSTSPSTGTTAHIVNASGPSTVSLFEVQQSGTPRYLFAPATAGSYTVDADQSGATLLSGSSSVTPFWALGRTAIEVYAPVVVASAGGVFTGSAAGDAAFRLQDNTKDWLFGFENGGTAARYVLADATSGTITLDADGTSSFPTAVDIAGNTSSVNFQGRGSGFSSGVVRLRGTTTAGGGVTAINLDNNGTAKTAGSLIGVGDYGSGSVALDFTSTTVTPIIVGDLAAGAGTGFIVRTLNAVTGATGIAAFQTGTTTRVGLADTGEVSISYANATASAGTTIVASGVNTTATANDDNTGAVTASFAPALTAAANTFQAGAAVRVKAWGVVTSDGSAGNLTVLLVFGSGPTTLVTTGAQTLPNNLTNAEWEFEGYATFRTTGAGGTVMPAGRFTLWTAATTSQSWNLTTTTAVTYDTTAAQDWAIRTTADDAGTTITSQQIVWELLPQ